jgi:hypothetical protein
MSKAQPKLCKFNLNQITLRGKSVKQSTNIILYLVKQSYK